MSNERSYPTADAYRADTRRVDTGFNTPIYIRHLAKFQKEDYPEEEIEDTWASYRLAQMPGCCGVAISYNSQIRDELQGLGLGDYFHKERLCLIKDSGYSCAIATSIEANVVQKELFEKQGWKQVHSFRNKRTRNVVGIWVKDI